MIDDGWLKIVDISIGWEAGWEWLVTNLEMGNSLLVQFMCLLITLFEATVSFGRTTFQVPCCWSNACCFGASGDLEHEQEMDLLVSTHTQSRAAQWPTMNQLE